MLTNYHSALRVCVGKALRLPAPFRLPHGYRKASMELACGNVLGIMGGREAVMDGSPSPTSGDPHPPLTHRSVNRRSVSNACLLPCMYTRCIPDRYE